MEQKDSRRSGGVIGTVHTAGFILRRLGDTGAFLRVGELLLGVLTALLAAVLILYSGYVIYDTNYIEKQAFTSLDLLQYRPSIINDPNAPPDARTLAIINPDYRGWLTLFGTRIDYPFMQAENDVFYVSHDVYRNASLSGAIYLAAANSRDGTDSYNLMYGHHMDNGSMFGGLDLYADPAYVRTHRQGVMVAESDVYDLYVFSVVRTDAYEGTLYSAGNRMESVLTYLRHPDQRTEVLLLDEEVLSGATQMLALSTCMSDSTNGRLIIFLTMIPRGLEMTSSLTTGGGFPSGGQEDETGTEVDGRKTTGEYTTTGDNPCDNPCYNPCYTPCYTPCAPCGQTQGGGCAGDGTCGCGGRTCTGGCGGNCGGSENCGGKRGFLDWFGRFRPAGLFRGSAWALVNLIAWLVTAYLLLPVCHIRAKYGRAPVMRKINRAKSELYDAEDLNETETLERTMIALHATIETARYEGESIRAAIREAEEASFAAVLPEEFADSAETLFYRVRRFLLRLRAAIVAEGVIILFALVTFLVTEDMRLPMTLVDEWTPLMLLYLALCWGVDVCLARYWERVRAEDDQKLRRAARKIIGKK